MVLVQDGSAIFHPLSICINGDSGSLTATAENKQLCNNATIWIRDNRQFLQQRINI